MLVKNAGTLQILGASNTKDIEIRASFCMANHIVHTF